MKHLNHGVDDTPKGLRFCSRGDACNKMIHENGECETIHPLQWDALNQSLILGMC